MRKMTPQQRTALIAAVVLFIVIWICVIAFRVTLMSSDTPVRSFT